MQAKIMILWLFAVLLACAPQAFSETNLDSQKKMFTYSNPWLDITIEYEDSIVLKSLHFNGYRGHDFLWPAKGLKSLSEPFQGAQLLCFARHPAKSNAIIEFATPYTASVLPSDATTDTLVQISSAKKGLSIRQTYQFSSLRSSFLVSTTIKNEGEKPISFYPTDIIYQNTRVPGDGFSYIYIPCDTPYNVLIGDATRDNIAYRRATTSILSVSYENSMGEISCKSTDSWIDLYNENTYGSLSIEYTLKSEHKELKEDDRILFINGAGSYEKDGRFVMRTENTDPFMRISNVLAQTTLKPGEEFCFDALWSASTTIGPVFQAKDGLSVNTPFKVYKQGKNILVIGLYGIPFEGNVGFDFWDTNGNLLQAKYDIDLNLRAPGQPARPSKAVPTYPTVLMHQIMLFALNANPDYSIDDIQKVRFVLVDGKTKDAAIIHVVSEIEGPLQEYTGKVY
jgi:hypothetical protein